jgi:hypothetical protein
MSKDLFVARVPRLLSPLFTAALLGGGVACAPAPSSEGGPALKTARADERAQEPGAPRGERAALAPVGEDEEAAEGERPIPGAGAEDGEPEADPEGDPEREPEGEADGGLAETPAVWRPFSDDSPWNTPIPADVELEPDSAALIDDLAHSSPFGVKLDINISRYSIPLHFADEATPTLPVVADIGGQGWGRGGPGAVFDMPLPAGAVPDPESDHHLAVVDRERGLEWGCWTMQLNGSRPRAGLCATSDLRGSGVRPRADQASPWWDAHGARACGFPLVAGLIRPEEIEAGKIEHALVIAYPHIRAGFYTPPASTAQARVRNNAVSTRGIPCGGQVQLDPAVDVEALEASPAAKVILRALQEYGAYVGDYSGGITIYADGSPEAQEQWRGVLDTSSVADVLDFDDLRVVRMGPLFDNGNG